jgi:hypothetical protein
MVGRRPGDPEADESFETYEEYRYSEHVISQDRVWVFELPELPSAAIAIPEGTDVQMLDRVVAAVRALPDSRLIERLTLLGKSHRDERWLRRQLQAPDLAIEAETTPLGETILYRSGWGESLEQILLHEWNYHLRSASPAESAAFDRIGDLEPFEFGERLPDQAHRGDERWSYFGDLLLEPGGEALLAAAAKPVHAALWGKAFGARIGSLPAELRGPHYESHRFLAAFIDGVVRPQALQALESNAGDLARARSIAEVLS